MASKKTRPATQIKEPASTRSSVIIDGVLARATEWSTWAGALTIGSVMATGGLASWLNPTTLPVLLAGLGLIAGREAPKEGK